MFVVGGKGGIFPEVQSMLSAKEEEGEEKKQTASAVVYAWSISVAEAQVSKEVVLLSNWISEHHVELICWDFDQTAMTLHTGGYVCEANKALFDDRINALSHHVSPGFRLFSRYIFEVKPNVKQAIVSFADDFSRNDPNPINASDTCIKVGGTDLIKMILERGFSWPRPPFHIVSFYPDVANSVRQFSSPVPKNKAVHMHVACEQANILDHSKVLLIDNDINNCRQALKQGYRAWLVTKQAGFDPPSLTILK